MNLRERLERGGNPFFRCFAGRMRTGFGQVRFPWAKPFERLGTACLMGGIPPLGPASFSLVPLWFCLPAKAGQNWEKFRLRFGFFSFFGLLPVRSLAFFSS